MILVLLLIGAILIVVAVRGTQQDLFSALRTDVPDFVVWAAAIVAIGAIGFIPGLKPLSRGLLALIVVVLIINNYKQIVAGFANAWQSPPKAAAANVAGTQGGSSGSGTLGDIGKGVGDALKIAGTVGLI